MCGNTTSTAGLTVTLCKEGGTGDFALEAGALVLADQGWEREKGGGDLLSMLCVYMQAVAGGGVRVERFNIYICTCRLLLHR